MQVSRARRLPLLCSRSPAGLAGATPLRVNEEQTRPLLLSSPPRYGSLWRCTRDRSVLPFRLTVQSRRKSMFGPVGSEPGETRSARTAHRPLCRGNGLDVLGDGFHRVGILERVHDRKQRGSVGVTDLETDVALVARHHASNRGGSAAVLYRSLESLLGTDHVRASGERCRLDLSDLGPVQLGDFTQESFDAIG